ncbi:imelysin family protein [Paenibacillus flagellatus]|uniref:EfeM/EfeO family lipoprotein n=1 Tax=Paenibacillus flagellatus TaxID=2211139 RepID=A0A2V5K2H9_9BACL|nr:imelysin family protein [Paenibacillus flagellatus]PYI53388.1 EfeM/EfeO family lipoprotein [Paenibacillus flagellatus]
MSHSFLRSFRHRAAAACAALALTTAAAGCGGSGNAGPSGASGASANVPGVDLSRVNSYLVAKSTDLQKNAAQLKKTAQSYYDAAKSVNFDYDALWSKQAGTVGPLLVEAKKQFLAANSAYETMEGIVAGVEELSHYDIDLDAGIPAGEGSEDVVSFDVKLPNGETLKKPGNYFYLAELTLWGTKPEWTAQGVKPDLDGSGKVDFGEVLPDANVLKGVADGFAAMSDHLLKDAGQWKATLEESLTALVVMIPTMDEYFQAWKQSRSVSGDNATSAQFVAVSRLQDIRDILSGLEVVYASVRPAVEKADAALAKQTGRELDELLGFVSDLYEKEKNGTAFKAEQADALGADAQNRASAIAGQLTQAAAKLGIKIRT